MGCNASKQTENVTSYANMGANMCANVGANMGANEGAMPPIPPVVTQSLQPFEFVHLGLPDFDAVFTSGKSVADSLLKVNGRLIAPVKGFMEAGDGGDLESTVGKTIVAARAAVEDALPSNIEEIRATAQTDPQEALKMVEIAMRGMKGSLPDVDASNVSKGDLKIELPTLALDKLGDGSKKAFVMMQNLALETVAVCTGSFKEIVPVLHEIMERMKALKPTDFAQACKDAGMGMMQTLEKGKHFATNVALSIKLTEYVSTVVKQITAIATSLAAGFEKALQKILMYAPGLEDMKGYAQSAVNDAKTLAGVPAMAATSAAGVVAKEVYINSVVEPVEFTDTDGDVNRLAMDGSGGLVWYQKQAGGWTPWDDGPLVFTPSTGLLCCDAEDAGYATIKDPEATSRLLRAARGPANSNSV